MAYTIILLLLLNVMTILCMTNDDLRIILCVCIVVCIVLLI